MRSNAMYVLTRETSKLKVRPDPLRGYWTPAKKRPVFVPLKVKN